MHNLVDVPGDINLAHDRGPIFRLLGNSISSRLETRLLAFNGGQSHFSGGRSLVSGPSDCCTAIDIALLGALKRSSELATPSHRIARPSNFGGHLQLRLSALLADWHVCVQCVGTVVKRERRRRREQQEIAKETFQSSPRLLPSSLELKSTLPGRPRLDGNELLPGFVS